jgi:hypothetical protein
MLESVHGPNHDLQPLIEADMKDEGFDKKSSSRVKDYYFIEKGSGDTKDLLFIRLLDTVRKLAGQPVLVELLRIFKSEDGAMWVNTLEPLLVTNKSVVSRSDYAKIFPKYEKLHQDMIKSHQSFSEALQDLGTSLEASSRFINKEEESKHQP